MNFLKDPNRSGAAIQSQRRLALSITDRPSAQIALGGEDVKPKFVLVAVVIFVAMMSVTPALTAPRQIQDLCSEQARHVTFSYRGDYEAFTANCIANHTPTPTTPTPTKKPKWLPDTKAEG